MPHIYIVCEDCTKTFFWKEEDQKYYAEKNFAPPKRCFNCRQSRKNKKETAEIRSEFDQATRRQPSRDNQNDFGIFSNPSDKTDTPQFARRRIFIP